MTSVTPEYLIQESGLWLGSQEQWAYLMNLAITYLEQDPWATPENFTHFIISNNF